MPMPLPAPVTSTASPGFPGLPLRIPRIRRPSPRPAGHPRRRRRRPVTARRSRMCPATVSRLLERAEVAPLGARHQHPVRLRQLLDQELVGVDEGRLLGVHQHHRHADLADPLVRQRADVAVVLRQRRLLEQTQQRPRVARQALQRPPLLGQVDRRADHVAQVRALLRGHVVARVCQRLRPVAPADPVVVAAQVLERGQRGLDRDHLAHALGVQRARGRGRCRRRSCDRRSPGRSISSASSRPSRSPAMSSGV